MQWQKPLQLPWVPCWFELHSSSGNSKKQAGGLELHWLGVFAEQKAYVFVCVCVCEIGHTYCEMLPTGRRAIEQRAFIAVSSPEDLLVINM